MKKLHFKTSKGEFLLKEYNENQGRAMAEALSDVFCEGLAGYELIGKVEKLTEDQAKEIVKSTPYCPKYWNYNLSYFREFHALESLDSLIRAIGVLWENPIQDWYDSALEVDEIHEQQMTQKYQEYQKNVFDKSRTYLFKKI